MPLVYWLPCIAALLHVLEEFVWPGGFLAWHRRYRPDMASSITARFALIANAVLLGATMVVGWCGTSWGRSASLWLTLAALLAGNAVFHLLGSWRMRGYSPGVVTATVLYLPLCVRGYAYFMSTGRISLGDAMFSFALGGSYQLWSMLMHRRGATPA